jgi:Tfp pilus assembly protein PilN
MIKINLLDSVTDRARGIVDVEKEVSRPRTQLALVAGVAAFLLLAACGFDWWSTSRKHAKLTDELAEQQRIAQQVKQIKEEKDQLEKKKKAVEARIDAIQRLRDGQRGPVAVLEEIRDRINNMPGLYLKSIEQKGSSLVIEGMSADEETVTRFGRSMEFSSGLFTSLIIETQKTVPQETKISATGGETTVQAPAYTSFTVRCTYNPPGSKPEDGNQNNAANAVPQSQLKPAAAPVAPAAAPAAK